MKKRFCAALASVMMLGTALTSPVSAAETYQKGDVNMDGIVDVADAQLVVQDYLKLILYMDGILTKEQRQLGNVDGKIFVAKASKMKPELGDVELVADVQDAQFIVLYYVEKIVIDNQDNSVSIEEFISNINN